MRFVQPAAVRAQSRAPPRRAAPTAVVRGEIRQVRQTFLGSMVQVAACPVCNGTGEVISTPCHVLPGARPGTQDRQEGGAHSRGVDTGTQIRLAGEGQPGEFGGPNGNLYLEVQVKPHKYFRRQDDNILLDMSINVAQAAIGADVDVPTVDGKTRLHIPPGTQPGKVFTIKARGVPHLRSTGRGDQLVLVTVEVPTHLNAEQRRLFEELGATMGVEAQPQEGSFMDKLKGVLGG